MANADPGLADRLAVWVLSHENNGRVITTRLDEVSEHVVYEAWESPTAET